MATPGTHYKDTSMRKVKLAAVPSDSTVTTHELDAALRDVSQEPRTPPEGAERPSYLVGMPVFDCIPFRGDAPALVPMGQYGLARDVLPCTRPRQQMLRRVRAEYRAIVQAMLAARIDFHVLNVDDGETNMGRWLKSMGCESMGFPVKEPSRWLMYPRDMFVYVAAIDTLLVHSRLFQLRSDRVRVGTIVHAEWGEGGRVLVCGDRLLFGCHPEAAKSPRIPNVLRRLKDRGMEVAAIPQALFYCLSRRGKGRPESLRYETHLDRSATLLMGADGGYHLLLDPHYRTGELTSPLSQERSITLVRRACEKIDVQVHVPKRGSVPYATAAVQFGSGEVLMTGNDEETLTAVAGIVGRKNVRVTDIAISHYPVFAGAGIHCLITETPRPLV